MARSDDKSFGEEEDDKVKELVQKSDHSCQKLYLQTSLKLLVTIPIKTFSVLSFKPIQIVAEQFLSLSEKFGSHSVYVRNFSPQKASSQCSEDKSATLREVESYVD